MRYSLLALALTLSIGLAGCSNTGKSQNLISHSRKVLLQAADYDMSTPINTENSLSQAASSASASLAKIASYDQALHPSVLPGDNIDPRSSGLDGVQTINWIGSAATLLKQMSPTIGYKLRIVGKPKGIEPTVTIDVKSRMVIDILRNIKYQLHQNKVELMIDPEHRLIELQYSSESA